MLRIISHYRCLLLLGLLCKNSKFRGAYIMVILTCCSGVLHIRPQLSNHGFSVHDRKIDQPVKMLITAFLKNFYWVTMCFLQDPPAPSQATVPQFSCGGCSPSPDATPQSSCRGCNPSSHGRQPCC